MSENNHIIVDLCDYPDCIHLADELIQTDEGDFHTCYEHLDEYLTHYPNLAERNGFDAEEMYYQ